MENTKEQVVAEWKAVNEPRLKEIKSANPDLYSAINLALNYLNKKLGGDALPIEVEEERIYEEIFPKETETNVWRFKTRDELDAEGIDNFRSINPKYVYENYAGKPWDELYDKKLYKSFNEALNKKFKDGYSLSSLIFYTQNPLPAQSTANPETYPAQSELTYSYSFTPNKGERKSPTQSAGELKQIAEIHSTSAVQIELLSTKFKGNDGNWYGINIGKTGIWTWKETTPPPAQPQATTSTASSQPASTTTTISQWKPEDLLSRMVNWNGSIFTINKIVKRNPKTIRYEFLNTSSAPMQVDVPKITIEALVTGNRKVKGISLMPTQSLQPTSTPENDFQLQLTKMTDAELKTLYSDTFDAKQEFTDDDEEYYELNIQLIDIAKEINKRK